MVTLYKRISFFVLLFCTFCVASSYGQSATISPYSTYGIGDLQNQNGVQSFSMGNTGIALHNDSLTPLFINLKNPASYVYNSATVFEAGILNNNIQMTSGGQTHTNSNAYFGYFAIAFPVGKHFGGSFGLRPMSSVGYNINTTGNIDSSDSHGNQTVVGNTTNQYIGTGGLNQLHFGVAYAPCKSFSIGMNASYVFGYLNYSQNVIYSPNLGAFNSQETENLQIHGFTLDYGAMLTLFKAKDSAVQLILGGTASLGSSLFADYNLLAISDVPASPQTNIDTIADSNASGRIKLPMTFGGGITAVFRDKNGNNQWTVSADFSTQQWSQYTVLGQAQNLTDSYQADIGAQFIPKKNSYQEGDFFKRIHYRWGFSYTKTNLDLYSTPLYDYCLSLGVAVPVGPAYGYTEYLGIINIGAQFGQLGTTSNDLIRERYAKVLVAFTFNNRWFRKRLYQ